MSLHIRSTELAARKLAREKSREIISSFLLAITLIVLALFSLAYFVLPTLEKQSAGFRVVHSQPDTTISCPTPDPTVRLPSRPTPPASSSPSQKLIVTHALSSVAIPTIATRTDSESFDFGSGQEDFGNGWTGTGQGDGPGAATSFGSRSQIASALKGNLYDFKQTAKGIDRKFDPLAISPYADAAKAIQRSRFRDSAFRKYYMAPQDLYLTHLAIPYSDAAIGPRFFDAEKEVKPTGWIANYRGTVTAPADGTYRFVGMGDDYLSVSLDGRPNLFACWPSLQESVRGSWKPSEIQPTHTGPFAGLPLVYGDWIKLKKGQPMEMNIAVGERPGGKVGFILLIQEKSTKYETDPTTNRPILPLFTTAPIPESRQTEITQDFKNFPLDWKNTPIFSSEIR